MKKLTALLVLALAISGISNAQQVQDLFRTRPSASRNFSDYVSKSGSLTLNSQRLTMLRSASAETLQLSLPFEGSQLDLDLKKASITAPGFQVIEALPDGSTRTSEYSDGVFYQGVIKGKPGSIASVSLVGGQVMAVIADQQSNIILGTVDQTGRNTEEYTIYRESDMTKANPLACQTGEIPVDGPAGTKTTAKGQQAGDPIEIYFECDYQMFTDRGSSTNSVINFVLGFFNSTAQLYAVEDIKVQVSQIKVWTTQDPESQGGYNTSNAVLTSFSTRMQSDPYVGDYAHFLSRRNLGGGVAWLLSNPCAVNRYYRCGVSAIDPTYKDFPAYSWTVEVVTHELGHNFGSNHTQWCGWVGGALDDCYQTEPNPSGAAACAPGPHPTNRGSIMSYCHLVNTVGINFANGFLQQPGDRIRTVIAGSACFATCKMTIAVNKYDAVCNLANGSATITPTANTGAVTYLWSNGATTQTVNGLASGTYWVRATDAAGCVVMEDVVIGQTGTTLPLNLNPSGNTGFCTGGNAVLTVVNHPAYSFQWSRNAAPVSGATGFSYTATTTGSYSILVTAGSCTANGSVTVTSVAPPTATISAGGPTTFCTGGSVTLDAGIGSSYNYQWFRNATAITGATGGTYTATTSGNYTVTVSAGSSCSVTSSATTVSATPAPTATVTNSGNASFCVGSSVTLTTTINPAYGYQWSRNGTAITGATQATLVVTQSGNYTVTSTQSTCSTTSAGTNISVIPLPVLSVSPVNSTITKFQRQTLTLTGATGYNFATQPYMFSSTANTIEVGPPATTVYTIRGTDANGCFSDIQATVNVIGCGLITNFTAGNLSPSRVQLRWNNPTDVFTDTVRYRAVGTATWNSVFVTGDSYEINGLQPGTDYEYEIIPLCTSTSTYLASAMQAFATTPLQDGLFVRLFPNPVVGTSRIEVISATPFTLAANLYDNSGKLVRAVVPNANFPAGQVIRSVSGSTLAAGVYHLAVHINGKLQNIRMVVVH